MLNILAIISTVHYIFIASSIPNMCRSINLYIQSFRLIRNSIFLSVSITLPSSFILPLFDYCNILLFSLPDYQIIIKLSIPISLKNILHLLDILDGSVISIPHDLNISGSGLPFFYSSHYSKYPKYFLLSWQL